MTGSVDRTVVWFHGRCSKCRQTRDLLDAKGIDYELYEYQTAQPTRDDLERVLQTLGTTDPRAITRHKEAAFAELALEEADRDTLLDALVAHPSLIERPIVIHGDRAVVARPPERLHELF